MAQATINGLTDRKPHRIEDCIAARGGPIRMTGLQDSNPRHTGHESYDEAHFWLNGYVNKQNCRIWSKANPQVHAETPLHPEKLTVWCALWAGGILLQKQ
ncbi:hypothetical protein TNCV_3396591 [Trichonephila clavipes]|nr:hypothetical protein TNCV_3396591 [Trichonephila clavipes]